MRRSCYKRIIFPWTRLPRNISSETETETATANKLVSPSWIWPRGPLPSVFSFPTRLSPLVSAAPLPWRLHAFSKSRSVYSTSRSLSTMATALKIQLSPKTDSGIFNSGVREDTARAASEALQMDIERHHVFFNDEGFHSRIFPDQLSG